MKSRLMALRDRLTQRWQAMPAAERKRALITTVLLVFAGYAMFHAFVTMPEAKKLATDLNRARGRAQLAKESARKQRPVTPTRSPFLLERDLGALKQVLAEQTRRLDTVRTRFADLENLAEHQQLRLGLADLANRSDIEVLSFETVGIRREEQHKAPTVERLREMAQSNRYQRPLLNMRARASYRGMMDFLDGLARLPHQVSPVRVNVQVKTNGDEHTPATRQWLELELDLAL